MKVSNQALADGVARITALPGVRGGALVAADAGLVWAAHGELAGHTALWEAATDFWRLQQRHALHFADLGAFGAAVMYHQAGLLAVFRCCHDPDLLFVAVGHQGTVNWTDLQRRVADLGRLLSTGAPVAAAPATPSSTPA